MATEANLGLRERYKRTVAVLLVPAWITFIVFVYVRTRPPQSLPAVNTLRVGALPVT